VDKRNSHGADIYMLRFQTEADADIYISEIAMDEAYGWGDGKKRFSADVYSKTSWRMIILHTMKKMGGLCSASLEKLAGKMG